MSSNFILIVCRGDHYDFLMNGVDLFDSVSSPDDALKLALIYKCPVYVCVQVHKDGVHHDN